MTDLDIYLAYPRHVAKIAALKAIARAVRELGRAVGEQEARQTIYEATRSFADSPAGNKGLYTPHCSTWMNQGRYLDDPQEWYLGAGPASQPGVFIPSPDDEVCDGAGNYITRRELDLRAARRTIQ